MLPTQIHENFVVIIYLRLLFSVKSKFTTKNSWISIANTGPSVITFTTVIHAQIFFHAIKTGRKKLLQRKICKFALVTLAPTVASEKLLLLSTRYIRFKHKIKKSIFLLIRVQKGPDVPHFNLRPLLLWFRTAQKLVR